MNKDIQDLNKLTGKIIGCAFTVSNTLGCGFLEKVYENAMMIELNKNGLQTFQQVGIQVTYDVQVVGDYFADLLVENRVVVELKAVKTLENIHFAQCLNYLHASGFEVCLLFNFTKPRLNYHRIVK